MLGLPSAPCLPSALLSSRNGRARWVREIQLKAARAGGSGVVLGSLPAERHIRREKSEPEVVPSSIGAAWKAELLQEGKRGIQWQ